MHKLFSGLCAATLTAAVAVTGALPAAAAPMFIPKAQTVQQSDVVQVNDHWKKKKRYGKRRTNAERGFYRNNNSVWYNGHRGYRYKRSGYRYYNGWWFPAGAFIAGAVIGGAIANSNNYSGGNAHVAWCYDRYRSYRASDNTFQPYEGPRRQCYSPYS